MNAQGFVNSEHIRRNLYLFSWCFLYCYKWYALAVVDTIKLAENRGIFNFQIRLIRVHNLLRVVSLYFIIGAFINFEVWSQDKREKQFHQKKIIFLLSESYLCRGKECKQESAVIKDIGMHNFQESDIIQTFVYAFVAVVFKYLTLVLYEPWA